MVKEEKDDEEEEGEGRFRPGNKVLYLVWRKEIRLNSQER